MKTIKVFPNTIYMAKLDAVVGSEQGGVRPVLVVDSYQTSSTCVVIPITLERANDKHDFHIDLCNGVGTVLVEQIRTIDKRRIFDCFMTEGGYATITENERTLINEQLMKICQLKPLRVQGKHFTTKNSEKLEKAIVT